MLDKIWNKYDEDGNMTLDRDEMMKFVYQVFGTDVSVKKANEIFNEVDQDSNGTIDRDEMLKFVKRLRD